jgi:hypothetical protein
MVGVRITVPPAPAEIRVRIPFDPSKPAGNGYAVLRDACGLVQRGSVKYNRRRGLFLVNRRHADALVRGLVGKYGSVKVVKRVAVDGDSGEKVVCTTPCGAASAETVFNCECICAGAYHGAGHRRDAPRPRNVEPIVIDDDDGAGAQFRTVTWMVDQGMLAGLDNGLGLSGSAI